MEPNGLDQLQRARLAMLRNSLKVVEQALATLETARSEQSPSDTGDLRAAVNDAAARLRRLTPGPSLNDQVEDIAGYLERAAAAGTSQLVDRRPRIVLDASALTSSLQPPITDAFDLLEEIETDIGEAQALEGAERADALTATWSRLDDLQRNRENIFVEYVDLVRGILLRDAGIDQDLCRIADELARAAGSMGSFSWQSLTIPVSDDNLAASSAQLIRIGFPEWSVWTLPFTIYEVGRLVTLEHRRTREVVDRFTTPELAEPEVRTWVADARATGIMGPAYVWAFVMLRANPADDGDDRRVAVMLEALHQVNTAKDAVDPDASAYGKQRGLIAEAWRDARARLSDETATTAAPPVAAEIVQATLKLVTSPLRAAEWPGIAEMGDNLGPKGPRPEDVARSLTRTTLHQVIAAAWTARMHAPSVPVDPDAVDSEQSRAGAAEQEEARLHDLAERARLVCVAVIDADDSGGGGAGAPPPIAVAGSIDKVSAGGKAAESASGSGSP